ncbi:MAG: retropepsin-like aspartic protease [Nitrospirota bacterium]|nr:retropepsin-like aspartic protease [Nitrospirota bacterium]
MIKLLFLTLIYVCLMPDFAGAGSVPTFSDNDLDRYSKPSERSTQPEKQQVPAPITRNQGTTKNGQQSVNKIEIPYTAFEGSSRRVIIPVVLNGSITAKMALDTGSPGMIIFDRLANRLGIFEKDDGKLLTYSAGIGGEAPSVLTIVDSVQVGRAEDKFIPTYIVASLSNSFDGLIGMDFMANYSIRIDTARHVVVFEELPDRQNMPGGHDELWWRDNFRNFAVIRGQWKQFRESLNKITMERDPKKLDGIKLFADRQHREADRLFTKLNNYAITHSVPMHWRQY